MSSVFLASLCRVDSSLPYVECVPRFLMSSGLFAS